MGVIALGVLGLGLGAAGAYMSAEGADDRRKELKDATRKFLPDIEKDVSDWFSSVERESDRAAKIGRKVSEADLETTMAMEEKAFPGFGEMRRGWFDAINPLAQGKLSPGLMESLQSSGAAAGFGTGMGGSGLFQLLFPGRFGVETQMKATGLLPALVSTLPKSRISSASDWLSQITTPQQRTATQMQVRQQNLALLSQRAGMETGGEVWGNWMQGTGGTMLGSAMGGGMGGGMFGGGGTAPTGAQSAYYTRGAMAGGGFGGAF